MEALEQLLNERIRYCNEDRCQSALQNQPPRNFLDRWLMSVVEVQDALDTALVVLPAAVTPIGNQVGSGARI